MKPCALALLCILAVGCSSDDESDGGPNPADDAGVGVDANVDDGATVDGGTGTDEGVGADVSAGVDDGTDLDEDASADEGTGVDDGTNVVDDDAGIGEGTGADEGANADEDVSADEGTGADEATGNDESTDTDEGTSDGEAADDTEGTGTDAGTPPETVAATFDISVPEYLSSELRVTLYSGERTVQADYVSGQSWTATMSLPNDGPFVDVIFFDRNGDLPLAASRSIRIAPTDPGVEDVTVEVDRFTPLDHDNDGIDNITELRQGTDPRVPDSGDAPPTIGWENDDVLERLRYVSSLHEAAVPAERPWSERTMEVPGDREDDADASRSITADIDPSGNGEYRITSSTGDRSSDVRFDSFATRRVSDDTVVWEGEYSRVTFPEDNTEVTFRSETRRDGEVDLRQTGSFSSTNTNFCCLPGETDVEYDVTGNAPDADGFCDVVHGSMTATRAGETGEVFSGSPVTTRYARENAQPGSRWRVTVTRNGIVFSDYEFDDPDGVDAQFHCDFGDL